MKTWRTGLLAPCLLLAAQPLFGQPVPSSGLLFFDSFGAIATGYPRLAVFWSFSIENGLKTLTLETFDCSYNPIALVLGLAFDGSALAFAITGKDGSTCLNNGGSPQVEEYSAIQPLLQELDTWANGLPRDVAIEGLPVRNPGPSVATKRTSLATVPAAAPPDVSTVFLDGLGGNILQVDLVTGATISTVTPPQTANAPLAIRPAATPPSNEVWVANAGLQMSVLNLAAQKVIANIPTPSLPSSATPAGIAFTNSGNICLEALRLPSPDASNNQGVLVVFDAVNRVVTSTLPLKYAPAQIVMAPDGLTAYLLSTNGEITYYDVLSGTADLSVSTYTPGMGNGYNGFSNVFIHPDGTRLFWAVGPYVESFDLTLRRVTAQLSSGLPTTSAIEFGLSQDGTVATMSNGQGSAVFLDAQYGLILAHVTFNGPAQILLGN